MSSRHVWTAALVVVGILALGLVWWGWLQSGLAFLQLGMGVC